MHDLLFVDADVLGLGADFLALSNAREGVRHSLERVEGVSGWGELVLFVGGLSGAASPRGNHRLLSFADL